MIRYALFLIFICQTTPKTSYPAVINIYKNLVWGEFCAVNPPQTKINGRYIEVAVLQRAGIVRVYSYCMCSDVCKSDHIIIHLDSLFPMPTFFLRKWAW